MRQPVANTQSVVVPKKRSFSKSLKSIYRSRQLYVLFAIPLVFLLVFKYYPMLGIQIAFKDFKATLGIWGSPWVGFKHFTRLFSAYQFERTIVNTLSLSLYSLIAGLPFPILLALSLNYLPNVKLRKAIQTISYAPHFISTVVMCGMILQFLSSYNGIVNTFIKLFGGKAYNFMGDPNMFSSIYVWSGIWQHCGYNSIILFPNIRAFLQLILPLAQTASNARCTVFQ